MDSDSNFHNIYNGSSGASFSGMVQDDYTFNPQGTGAGILNISLKPSGAVVPIPSGSAGYDFGQDTGPDPSINYRGAFPQGEPLWTDGWSALAIAGIL